ncbi:MAG: DUF937 domain-containing protein [Candidatus Eisenbacteria bacterium]|nr:DUF937 domain-containing protein [Candidatus Eisenbacteria bacterium]
MGFLEDLLKQGLGAAAGLPGTPATHGAPGAHAAPGEGGLGGLLSMVSQNPQILNAVVGLLSTRDSSVGGNGGLGALVGAFEQKGLGNLMSGWISTGPNPGISTQQVTDVLGGDTLGQFAQRAGVPASQAGSLLAGLLPAVVNHLTPDGKLPDTNALEGSLASLLSNLGR